MGLILDLQMHNTMTVRFLPDQEVPKRDKGDQAVRTATVSLLMPLCMQFEAAVQASLASLADLQVCTKLNAQDKQEFLKYWEQASRLPAGTKQD